MKDRIQMAQSTMGIIQRPQDTPVLLGNTLVWSGHPNGSSLTLYTSAAQPVSASPTPTYMTDLPICLSQGPDNDGSSFRSQPSTMLVKGAKGTWPSAGFHGNQWPNLTSSSPITGNLPPLLTPSPGSEDYHHVLFQCGPQTIGCPSRISFAHVSQP